VVVDMSTIIDQENLRNVSAGRTRHVPLNPGKDVTTDTQFVIKIHGNTRELKNVFFFCAIVSGAWYLLQRYIFMCDEVDELRQDWFGENCPPPILPNIKRPRIEN